MNDWEYSESIESEEIGRHLFIDIGFYFISAPTFKSGGYDESQLDLVSNWTDLEGVNIGSLFEIYRDLTWQQSHDSTEKVSNDFAEYVDDVETNGVQFF